jgi:hypothetical protein
VDKEIYYAIKDFETGIGREATENEAEKIEAELRAYHNYDDIDSKYRIKVIQYTYDEFEMEKAIARVEKAREYLETIKL